MGFLDDYRQDRGIRCEHARDELDYAVEAITHAFEVVSPWLNNSERNQLANALLKNAIGPIRTACDMLERFREIRPYT